jgi:hypothetical protein
MLIAKKKSNNNNNLPERIFGNLLYRAGQGRAWYGRAAQVTVFPYRYKGSDIRLKLAECEE